MVTGFDSDIDACLAGIEDGFRLKIKRVEATSATDMNGFSSSMLETRKPGHRVQPTRIHALDIVQYLHHIRTIVRFEGLLSLAHGLA